MISQTILVWNQTHSLQHCVRTAGLIQGQDKLVIRVLCRNYRNLSEVQVFVTNMGDTVEDLAPAEGCTRKGPRAR
jgi:hypothetical protein